MFVDTVVGCIKSRVILTSIVARLEEGDDGDFVVASACWSVLLSVFVFVPLCVSVHMMLKCLKVSQQIRMRTSVGIYLKVYKFGGTSNEVRSSWRPS